MTIISSFQEKKSASLMQSGTNVKYDPISWVNWSRQKSYNVCFSTRTLKKKVQSGFVGFLLTRVSLPW